MPDQEYPAEQVGDYGTTVQPAVAARMTPHLRMTQVGTGAGVLAVVASAAAIARFPRYVAEGSGVSAAVFALVCSVLMLAICVAQLVAWRAAMSWWQGRRSSVPQALGRLSWWLHVASYLVALAALWACIWGSGAAGWSASAATLLTLALLFVLAAQVLAAVQYVRASGPPGTIPTHVRRLVVRERARQAAAAAVVERDSPPQA